MYFLSYVSSKAALHVDERVYDSAPPQTPVVPSPKNTAAKLMQAARALLHVK